MDTLIYIGVHAALLFSGFTLGLAAHRLIASFLITCFTVALSLAVGAVTLSAARGELDGWAYVWVPVIFSFGFAGSSLAGLVAKRFRICHPARISQSDDSSPNKSLERTRDG